MYLLDMPEAPEQASVHPDNPAESLPFEASTSPDDALQNTPPIGDNRPTPSSEKTISCVSCRRRKLKCDRVKPKCGTCSRLRHDDCEYPERRRNMGAKRRNMKELEARLAQVETKLVAEVNLLSNNILADPARQKLVSLNGNMEIREENELDSVDSIGGCGQSEFNDQAGALSTASGKFDSQEIISLGLQEPLPTDEVQDELHQIYFDKIHTSVPMVHKGRYFTLMKLGPRLRPPVCLRYVVWALAASVSDKYADFEDVFYRRARRYAEAEEMKGHGEAFVTVYHAQTWNLLATYEAKRTFFTRAWMSSGRATRLAHMMGLYRLDGAGLEVRQILQPPRDWIELEERRRTFWGAYYGDRWASAGTGWPMTINESEILTNLPSSEEAFQEGREEISITLSEALSGEGASKMSAYAGVVVSATLFGHNFNHIHRKGPDEHPEDLLHGTFWERHRRMDNTLSSTLMFLPKTLRLPEGLRDLNVVFLNMNLHASTICLHQAAVMTAEKHMLDPNFIRQSQRRCTMAAEEITNIMRLITHIDASNMNSWMGFCLYAAGGVFIQDQKSAHSNPQSASNLEFLLVAMRAIGKRHAIADHFTAQLELDMAAAEIYVPHWKERHVITKIGCVVESQNGPVDGHLASESSSANGEKPNRFQFGQRKKPAFPESSSDQRLEPALPLGIMQYDSSNSTSPAQQLDNHFGTSIDNTSHFFIVSQEPRSIPASPPTALHDFSVYSVNDIPRDGKRCPSGQGDSRDDSPQNTVDSDRLHNEDGAGGATTGNRSRMPWILPDQQVGAKSGTTFSAASYGLRENRQILNSSAFSQRPTSTTAPPVSRHQLPISAPSPDVNSTQFSSREPVKRHDYEMWQTQEMNTYSMDEGWNLEMTDVTMQDGFQMATFGDNALNNGEGVAEFLIGGALANWNRD